jgi:hypothetical protein
MTTPKAMLNLYTVIACAILAVSLGAATAAAQEAEDDAENATTEEMVTTSVGDTDDADASVRAAMLAQIEQLKKTIAERRTAMNAIRSNAQTQRQEYRAERTQSRDEFFASLEGLSEEERREKMVAFVAELRAMIEARKAEMQATVGERKAVNEAFRADVKQNAEERRAALMKRIEEIRAQIAERQKQQSGTIADDADDVAEDEAEDESSEDASDE